MSWGLHKTIYISNCIEDLEEREERVYGELITAMKWFCDRVDKGEVRSVKTYARFKDLIQKYDKKN